MSVLLASSYKQTEELVWVSTKSFKSSTYKHLSQSGTLNKCFPEWRYALHPLHDGSILIAVFILFPTDTRRGNCFLEYRRGRCSSPLAMQISKSMCCCMDDDAVKAWGPRCELCPRKGEALYSQLCTDTLSK